MDYNITRLPEYFSYSLVVRSIGHFAYYTLLLLISSLYSFLCGVVNNARKMGERRISSAANDGRKSGGH